MAHIYIVRSHSLGIESARVAADRVAEDLRGEHHVKSHWEGDTLMVRKTGVRGELVVSENRVVVNVKLGFSMSLFRRVLEKEINDQLDEHLATRA